MLLELAAELLVSNKDADAMERDAERKPISGKLPVAFRKPGAFKRRLNESGWLADEVVAAGWMQQGKPSTMLAMVTGKALIDLARSRRSKSLPREFVLAATRDRIVAYQMSAMADGDGDTTVAVKVKPGERGAWSRASVRLLSVEGSGDRKTATLDVAGEQIPVWWDSDPSTDEFVELLSH